MAKRSDMHRPGAIIPSEYRYVLSYSMPSTDHGAQVPSCGVNCELDRRRDGSPGEHAANGRCCVIGLRLIANARFAETGGAGHCSVCGAYYIHGDVWMHEPTGEYIHIGHDCAAKYELLADRTAHELSLGRARAGAARAVQAAVNKEEREAFLAANPGLAEALTVDHKIVRDIAERFVSYRSMSENQIALVFKLAAEVLCPARPEERHVVAPTGRITFQGVVVSAKVQEGDWGNVLKLVVKVATPDGNWLAYLTCPSDLASEVWASPRGQESRNATTGDLLRGCMVELTATLKPGRESHFALGSRPRGKMIISTETAEAARTGEEHAQ